MSVDLHPEDLFDKEARGTLSVEERERLDLHLRACAVCRFERLVMHDVADEVAGAEEADLATRLDAGPEGASHPEELFDKRARGTLTTDERVRLASHVAACAACRLEERARADFHARAFDEDPAYVESLVERAMAATQTPVLLAGTPVNDDDAALAKIAGLPTRRVWGRRTLMVFAAACLMLTGVAAGASGLVARAWDFARKEVLGSAQNLEVPIAQGTPAPTAAPRSPVHEPTPSPTPLPVPTPVQESTPTPTPIPIPTPTPIPTPSPTPVQAPVHGPIPTPVLESAPVRTPAPTSPPSSVRGSEPSRAVETAIPGLAAGSPSATPRSATSVNPDAPLQGRVPEVQAESASSLFERANAARRRGETQAANILYTELQSRFPESAEARLSVAILARLALDRGNPGAALVGFDSYLRSGNPSLREQAMEGRALARERLGRVEEEKRAWRDLLNAFPRSAYADHAEKRLHGP